VCPAVWRRRILLAPYFAARVGLLIRFLRVGGWHPYHRLGYPRRRPEKAVVALAFARARWIAAGIIAFIWPDITAVALLYLIAAWAVITGIFEIVAAVQLRKEIEGEWLLALGGMASVIFGVLLMVFPSAGVLTVVWLIGAYAAAFGVLLLIVAFRLYRWQGRVRHIPVKTAA
jgi:hypothetical protein